MVEFIDKTSEQNGTPVNRENLMAIQGFQATEISINNGSVFTITNENGHTLEVTRIDGGGYREVFTGEKTISKTIRFENGKIVEVLE